MAEKKDKHTKPGQQKTGQRPNEVTAMPRTVRWLTFLITIVFAFALITRYSPKPCQAEAPIRVLNASATSSADKSTPITDLLALDRQGYWEPKSRDGTDDEGIQIQFETPTLVDWIEITVKGQAALAKKVFIGTRFYMDGKWLGPTKEKGSNNDGGPDTGMEYGVALNAAGKDLLISLGARNIYTYKEVRPMNSSVRTIFVSNLPAGVSAIRFFRKDRKQPLALELPSTVHGSITASSTLSPETAYHVRNLFDSQLDFAWSTDGKKTTGVGETITIKMDEPRTLSGFFLWNGYQRSETHYRANARPSRVKVTLNNDKFYVLSVKDQLGSQRFTFPEAVQNVTEMTIQVEAVYPGSSYKDMVISEIKLLDEKNCILMVNIPPLEVAPKSPQAERLLDTSWRTYMLGLGGSEWYSGTDFPIFRLRVRSNGSFVAYTGFYDSGVLEGNWEPLDNGVRIFGKRYATNPLNSDYLQAMKSNSGIRIFQSNIEMIDVSKVPLAQVKKHLQTILADRDFYKKPPAKNSSGKFVWWTGLEPWDEHHISGANEEELILRVYQLAVQQKALLLISSLFTDLFVPAQKSMSLTLPW